MCILKIFVLLACVSIWFARSHLGVCLQFIGIFNLLDDLNCTLWAAVFFHCFPFFVDLSGHEKNPLFPHQVSRAEYDFSYPAFCKEVCDSESGSDTEDERRLPDVILDDLANRRFQVKKRPLSFISKTTSLHSGPQIFPPDTLATGLHTLTRSEMYLS